MSGKLILCATPIGNLGDVTARLEAELSHADLIYAEDTRRAAVLLQALGVHAKARSYFVGNEERRAIELEEKLAAGATVALITDAGMPAIADPGLSAVHAAQKAGAEITVVPGASAVTTALAVSGLPAERFVFEGFLPRKGKERAQRLAQLASEERTIVLFAAKSRVAADLGALREALGGERPVVVARELTKAFEEIWRGDLATATSHWGATEPRGEFTLVVGGAAPSQVDIGAAVADVNTAIRSGTSMTDAVRQVAAATGAGRRQLYEAVLRFKET